MLEHHHFVEMLQHHHFVETLQCNVSTPGISQVKSTTIEMQPFLMSLSSQILNG